MPSLDEASARVLASRARVARLATVGEDGRPHLVPVVFALEGDVLYTPVDEKPKRTIELQRLRNIRANPRVALLVDRYEEDWSLLWWVRMRGRAGVVEEGPARDHGMELLRAKYPQYGGWRLEAVTVVEVTEWRAWRAGGPAPGE